MLVLKIYKVNINTNISDFLNIKCNQIAYNLPIRPIILRISESNVVFMSYDIRVLFIQTHFKV